MNHRVPPTPRPEYLNDDDSGDGDGDGAGDGDWVTDADASGLPGRESEPPQRVLWITIPQAGAGGRLDKVLATAAAADAPGLTRARLQALIADGQVFSGDQTITDGARRVKAGERFRIDLPPPVPARPVPQEMPLAIVYQDEALLVIDKPAGLVVHPGAGTPDGTLVNGLLAYCGVTLSGIGGVRRPGIVHRLDKDTSGLLVVARTDQAHLGLSRQFADRSLSRRYLAVVWGVPVPPEGEITGAIGRDPGDRKRMAVVAGGGKPALTFYRVEQRFGMLASLIACRLATGRTHQIRVHLAARGHPLVGDPLYGRRPPAVTPTGSNRGRSAGASDPTPQRRALLEFPRQALHAAALSFVHPVTGIRMTFQSPVPPDMHELLGCLEG